jgi:predicted SnoaL-like aldol condensation-catalyzing enzyme
VESTTEQNREVVLRLFANVLNGKIEDALELVHENYVEHNPMIGSDRAGMETYLRGIAEADPAPDIRIQRVIAENEYVVVHYETHWGLALRSTAAIDIFEVRDGLITQHWDVVEPLAAEGGDTDS